ncbi:CRISPR-associated endonuclease Cas1 [Stomatohabitans albus]|uniref:CRISPR-associated endonuclease Cas4g/Cas1g n=1 Tax=Stomatohabitans albus TaxID=3110766 RepID=UPI00300C35BF
MNPVPDLVPARMVSEFVYCKRSFYLEWVLGQFQENHEVAEGTALHRKVNAVKGSVPATSEEKPFKATSVQLSSPELGLVAKLDVLEGDGSFSIPIEFKRGAPQLGDDPVWLKDKVQVLIQALLLREAGHKCSTAYVWYDKVKRRVSVPITKEAIDWALAQVADLKKVAASHKIPKPLIDSPKCRRCSLVEMCIPDETNALDGKSAQPPRRMVATDPASRALYITTQGTYIGLSNGVVELREDRVTQEKVRLLDVSEINLYGRIEVSSTLIGACLERNIPILWFSSGGWFKGYASGAMSGNVDLRRRQVLASITGALDYAKTMIAGKIANCRTLLRRNAKIDVEPTLTELTRALARVKRCKDKQSLLGVEGIAAKAYFSAFDAMLKAEMGFTLEGRNKRPPTDPVNAMLSFLYAALAKEMTVSLLSVGFDPYQGLLHEPRFNRAALALDMMEEFRPLVVDSTVVKLVNTGVATPDKFQYRGDGCIMKPGMKKDLLRAYERRLDETIIHPVFKYRTEYRRALRLQCRLLAGVMMEDIAKYVAFTTR